MEAIDYGFVSICLSEKDCSPAGTLSVKNVSSIVDSDARISKIRKAALKNLANTLRIMWFMSAHGICLYRFASHLIPLATHELIEGWEWWKDDEIIDSCEKIGRVIKEKNFKVSMHLPDYCVMNSESVKFMIVKEYLDYFAKLFNLMGLDHRTKVVSHVGGGYGNKDKAIERLYLNFRTLPRDQQQRLVFENDDVTYTAMETLSICKKLNVPMVLDIHHHQCINNGEDIAGLLPGIFETWIDRPPKVHVSSPKSDKEFRAHADYVDSSQFIAFADTALAVGEFDIMVEAKMKDLALMRLFDDIPCRFRPTYLRERAECPV